MTAGPQGNTDRASRFVLTCKAGVVWILTKGENQSRLAKNEDGSSGSPRRGLGEPLLRCMVLWPTIAIPDTAIHNYS